MDPVTGEPAAGDFTLEAVDGTSVSLDDYRDRFVLLNFWATWCAPCRKEMPALDNLHKELSDAGLDVIGVHVGPSLDEIKRFLDQVPVEFTIVIDQDMILANWGVMGLPTTFLISPEGKIIYRAVGEREWDSARMIRFIRKAMSDHQRLVRGDASDSETAPFLENLKKFLGLNVGKEKEGELLPN